MSVKITTLIENSAKSDIYYSEHGLSLLVEANGVRVLYDTGSSSLFLKNAKTLDADLNNVDALVLSHGHYDHTGGVDAIVAHHLHPKKIYLGKHFFDLRYTKKRDGLKEIGATFDENTLNSIGSTVVEVEDEPVSLGKGLWAVSGFKTTYPVEELSAGMMKLEGGMMKKDTFQDEVVLVVETEKELAVISGCSHIGILSIVHRVSELFNRPVTMFVGGTHLVDSDDERIQYTCEQLKEEGITRLGACHCNGERAATYFEEHFPGFFRNTAGACIVIES